MRTAHLLLVAGLVYPTATLRADDSPKAWEFIGQTQAAATVDVRAQVTGRLIRLAVREGNAVKKGDLLAEIDPRTYRLELDAARAQLKIAEARLQVAKIETANAQKLFQQKVLSQNELELRLAKQAEAEAALLIAKAEMERAELTLSRTRLVAPFDGRVSQIQAAEGGLISADRTHILTVVDTKTMHVSFQVPEAILLQLQGEGLAQPDKLGVAIGLAIDKGHPHEAKLDLIASEIDPKTATVRFRASLPNPKGLLLPGMSARVRLTPIPSK